MRRARRTFDSSAGHKGISPGSAAVIKIKEFHAGQKEATILFISGMVLAVSGSAGDGLTESARQKLWEEIIMEYTFSVEEATQKLYTRLSEATGWKYLKSQERCTSNGEAWYDISAEEKLLSAFDELNHKIHHLLQKA